MNTYIAKLQFASPLAVQRHTGPGRLRPVLRSDTLFSAMCHTWSALYGRESLDELTGRGEAPKCLVSSVYVYTPTTFYLPKPLTRPPYEPDPVLARRVQKVEWLPLGVFRSWVQDSRIDWDRLLTEEPLGFAASHAVVERSRAARDRRLDRAAPFRNPVIEFGPECGGYAIFQAEGDEWANRLNRCLMLLGEMGIGGRRSIGLGQFTVATGGLVPAPSDWDFLRAAPAQAGVVLSLYAPEAQETTRVAEAGAYSLCSRAGWAASPTAMPPAKK